MADDFSSALQEVGIGKVSKTKFPHLISIYFAQDVHIILFPVLFLFLGKGASY